MVPHYQPSSPTPRPEGVVEALASSPPVARRRRLNSCSSGAGQITGIAGWRRAPRTRHGSLSSLGMGMQSTPAKRSKSLDTVPWDSKATRRTEKQAEEAMVDKLRGALDGGDFDEQLPVDNNTQQGFGDPQTPINQWQDPLETTSESMCEVYQDLELPTKLGTPSTPATPRGLVGGNPNGDEHTPRGQRWNSRAFSFGSHHNNAVLPNDEEQRMPTAAERVAATKIASGQLTPRPKLDLPPSDPPWSSTPSVFHDESFPKPRYRDTSSPSPPEIPRRWYSSVPPWELRWSATPPSSLQLGLLLDDDFASPSSVPLPEYDYNAEREERALQPDPFGFSCLAAMIAGRTPQVFLPSSQGEEVPVREYTPLRYSSPSTGPEDGSVSPEGEVSMRQSSPPRDRDNRAKKKHYWLGERIYKRMERASGPDSDFEAEESPKKRPRKSKSSKNSKKQSAPAMRTTPEPDPATLSARAARIAHFKEVDEQYNLNVEYVWS